MRVLVGTMVCLLAIGPIVFCDDTNFYYEWEEFFAARTDGNTGMTAFPVLLVPMGGKYEGMGTAYTAIAADSGFIEANPSGSSILQDTELSFLHHNWIADSNVEGVVYAVRFDDLGIGLGGKFLYLPFTRFDPWGDRQGKGYYSETVATVNVSYNFFSNYYFSGVAIGANVKFAYRNVPAAIYPDQSAFSAMVDVGILTRLDFLKLFISRSKNFSFGAAVKNLGSVAAGDPLPSMATFGLAYSPVRPLTIAVDLNIPFSLVPESFPQENWSVASGLNVVVADFLSIQGGLHLKGDNPRISIGSTLQLDKTSFIANHNLDLSGRINPLDKFSVEAKLHLGDRGRAELQKKAEELYLTGLEAYADGNLAEAIQYWEMVLEVDPKFMPARENIETATRALELQKEIEDRQKLE